MLKLSRWALCAALCIGSLEIIAVSQAKPASDQKPSAADQPAIIKELNTSTRFENDGSSTQTVSERIQVQNEAGIKLFGIITFSFTVGQNFSLDKMEVHKKDGSIIKAGAENVQETTPQISHVA